MARTGTVGAQDDGRGTALEVTIGAMPPRDKAIQLIKTSLWLASASLFLLLISTVIQLSIREPSGFTLAMNTFTIGVLSITATLIGKAIHTLRQR